MNLYFATVFVTVPVQVTVKADSETAAAAAAVRQVENGDGKWGYEFANIDFEPYVEEVHAAHA